MPQGQEEKYQASNPNLVLTANNMAQPKWSKQAVNYADLLNGVRPQPQIPAGGGGTNIQQFAGQMQPQNNITNLQGAINRGNQSQLYASNFAAAPQQNVYRANPMAPAQPIDPTTGEPIPRPGMEPHTRADMGVPNANDIINTVQPVGPPQPATQIPGEVQGAMNNIMNYFNQNPDAATAVFGQGGFAGFQNMIQSLFNAAPQYQQPPQTYIGAVQNMSRQVRQMGGGSTLQGLKALFSGR